jgi:3-deoxy-D-manno-octulosonate 8-phosphate phosphatase KdsC-like HAD superfamily phosphatase
VGAILGPDWIHGGRRQRLGEIAGLSATPAGSIDQVQQAAKFVALKSGGDGAVRELIDAILSSR